MLEECGLDYNIIPVDIGGGDQFKAEFLAISPNNRMPAIVDTDPTGGGDPITIFESGAILEYLAEKTGKFMPSNPRDRFKVLQWLHWQMANLGPMMGNANHFKNYGKNLTSDPKQLEYGTKRFVGEVDRLSGVMDAQLAANEYLGRFRIQYRRHRHLALGDAHRPADRRGVMGNLSKPQTLGR